MPLIHKREDVMTEPTEDVERKRHYQTLKSRCLLAAAVLGSSPHEENQEEAVEAIAKRFYRSVTDEEWGSEPVEAVPDADDKG